jgi:two-component system, cell cycle response regulator DivK
LKEKILIVEDNDMNRILLRAILLPYGFEVIEAVNGQEGVAVARERLPDLIVMDLQMPVMNGIDAMRVLKNDPRTQGIPVIAVTAFAMDGDREATMAAGFDGYIAKPFNANEMPKLLRSYLTA